MSIGVANFPDTFFVMPQRKEKARPKGAASHHPSRRQQKTARRRLEEGEAGEGLGCLDLSSRKKSHPKVAG